MPGPIAKIVKDGKIVTLTGYAAIRELSKRKKEPKEIKGQRVPYHKQDTPEKDLPKRPIGLGAALRGGGRAFSKGGKV